uniref:Riboflavin kinase n=1 Tax=Equus caballus TaxID=9796 RepID=A0A9L0RQ49_HORSE
MRRLAALCELGSSRPADPLRSACRARPSAGAAALRAQTQSPNRPAACIGSAAAQTRSGLSSAPPGPLCTRPPDRPSSRPCPPAGPGGAGITSTAAPQDARIGLPAPRADGVMRHLPYFCRGEVVRGFGRGSKQLGIPTANFPEQVVDNLPADLSTGIYYGWASVGSGDVHKMVVSIGWNPYYKNTKKSMETHIMHTFKEDFYGEILNVAIVGYLRPERNFDSLESLISAIHGDIEEAKKRLDLPEHLKLKEDSFFQLLSRTQKTSQQISKDWYEEHVDHNIME